MTINLKKINFEEIVYNSLIDLGDDVRRNIEVERVRSRLYHLRAKILANKLVDETKIINREYEIPANWWQHLKKRLGLKYKTKKITLEAIVDISEHIKYPKSDLDLFYEDMSIYKHVDALGDNLSLYQEANVREKRVVEQNES